MSITRIAGGVIPHYYNPNKNQRELAQDVIVKLDYADLWRSPSTLKDNKIMRVDMQGHIVGPPKQYNIQVQVDGLKGSSTVAHANISSTIQTNDPANQKGVLKAVIGALNMSLDTGKSYTVEGTSP